MTIISLTSYPDRFTDKRFLDVLSSLAGQKDCGHVKICLTLCVDDLPSVTSRMIGYIKEHDIEVLCSNVNHKAYLKFLLTAAKYGESDDIVTVDDDRVYDTSMVSCLLSAKERHPHCILAGRTHRILYDGRIPRPYRQWDLDCTEFVDAPRSDLLATGVGGVLYPAGFFTERRLGLIEGMMHRCPMNDDFTLTKAAIDGGFDRVLVPNTAGKYVRNCGFFCTEFDSDMDGTFNRNALCRLNVLENGNDAFRHVLALD